MYQWKICRAFWHAGEVIVADAFEPIKDVQVEVAKRRLETCEKVICCKEVFGTYEYANQELLEHAKRCGIKIENWKGSVKRNRNKQGG